MAVVLDPRRLFFSAALAASGGQAPVVPTLSQVLTQGNDANGQSILDVASYEATGLTGATAGARFVGATASGAPASGTFAVGDFIVTEDGNMFVCTAAGSPGTWTEVGTAGGVTELNYTEKTSNVTVSATAEGTPTTIHTASAGIVLDGSTKICVEFYAPTISAAASASGLINLWDDTAGASLGRIWAYSGGTSVSSFPVWGRRYFTPAAGTRTYSVRGWRSGADFTVVGGAAGATAYMPMYIRITSGG